MRNIHQLETEKARDLTQSTVREVACILEAEGGTERTLYVRLKWANLQAKGKN